MFDVGCSMFPGDQLGLEWGLPPILENDLWTHSNGANRFSTATQGGRFFFLDENSLVSGIIPPLQHPTRGFAVSIRTEPRSENPYDNNLVSPRNQKSRAHTH